MFVYYCRRVPRVIPSFPTRRSSDLGRPGAPPNSSTTPQWPPSPTLRRSGPTASPPTSPPPLLDRKSTRLNSSHVAISYAVFCLKKKKHKHDVCTYTLAHKHTYTRDS